MRGSSFSAFFLYFHATSILFLSILMVSRVIFDLLLDKYDITAQGVGCNFMYISTALDYWFQALQCLQA